MSEIEITPSCGNVFVDLGFPTDEAAVMLIRIEVAARIAGRIKENGWDILEVSQHFGITQRQASQLVKTKIDDFSLDMLWTLAMQLGLRLELSVA